MLPTVRCGISQAGVSKRACADAPQYAIAVRKCQPAPCRSRGMMHSTGGVLEPRLVLASCYLLARDSYLLGGLVWAPSPISRHHSMAP